MKVLNDELLKHRAQDAVSSLSLDSLIRAKHNQGSVSRSNSPGVAEFTVSAGILQNPEEHVESADTPPLTRGKKQEILLQCGFTDNLKNMVELSRYNFNLEFTIQALMKAKGKQPIFSRFSKGITSSFKLLPKVDEAILKAQLEIMNSRGYNDDEICISALTNHNTAEKAIDLLSKLNYDKSSFDQSVKKYTNGSSLETRQNLLVELGFGILYFLSQETMEA
jgi:hypothetical protein